jgi:lipoprotein-anchoring transpeptidase ErfK/SrfK
MGAAVSGCIVPVIEVGSMSRIASASVLALLIAGGSLAACSDPTPPQKGPDPAKVAVTPAAAPVGPIAPVLPAASDMPQTGGLTAPPALDLPPFGQTIAAASLPASTSHPAPKTAIGGADPGLIKLEVWLDRAGFSPGVIDGRGGENLDHALAAYATARGLAGDGKLDKALWDSLAADAAPVVRVYQITPDDLAGPFIGTPPKDYRDLAKLPKLAYSDPQQLLSEKFHMDRKLLLDLNPGADFAAAGTKILVVAPHAPRPDLKVARIEVDKSQEMLRAFDAQDHLVAVYPASVGSTERPAPSGSFEVRAVAPAPAYYFDPDRLTFAPKGAKGKLKIAPGPNNPVGSTWIALNIETYGIHGSPSPSLIGKRQSHGCVRLTNWDAAELGKAVKAGTKVDFVGVEKPKA